MYKTLLSGLVFVGTVFVLGCSTAEEGTPVQQKEEEAGVEEVAAEETTEPTQEPTTSAEIQEQWVKMSEAEKAQEKAKNMEQGPQTPEAFEGGEHTDLSSGDTAVWSNGLELTIYDVQVAPNEGKAIVQRAEATTPGRGKDPKGKSEVEDEPDELIVYRWYIENNGSDTIRFGGGFPCEHLDENGVALRPGGTTREQMKERKVKSPRPLEQPLEPGQKREDINSVAPPTEGTTFEIVCVQPPRAGTGKANVAGAPESSKASWRIDTTALKRRTS